MKTSKTIFNMDTRLKKVAMKKAKSEGWTLSSFLNFATREYVNGNLRAAIHDRQIEEIRKEMREGKYITHEELVKKLRASRKN